MGQMGLSSEDVQLSQIIEMSMKDQTFEPNFVNPEMMMRKEGTPVGIRNVGNSKHSNIIGSLLFQFPPASVLHAPTICEAHHGI